MSQNVMRHISFIGLLRDRTAIMDKLSKLGVLDLNFSSLSQQNDDDGVVTISEIDTPESVEFVRKQSEIYSALSVLSEFDSRKKPIFTYRTRITSKKYEETIAQIDTLSSDIVFINNSQKEILSIENKISSIQTKIAGLSPWKDCNYSPFSINTRSTESYFVVFQDTDRLNTFNEAVQGANIPYGIDIIKKDGDVSYAIFSCMKSENSYFEDISRSISISKCEFDKFEGTFNDEIERLNAQIVSLKDEIKQIREKLSFYGKNISDYEILHDYYAIEADKARGKAGTTNTKMTFNFTGWVPAKYERKVVSELETNYVCHIEMRDPKEDELPPTAFENNPIGASIEATESMYSILKYGELDPSTIAAFFFSLFFGFMLSDAGYGILLTVGCIVILLKMKLEKSMRKYITLFLCSGISTIIWGAVFGSWFGNLIPTLTADAFALKPLWFDPLDTQNTQHFLSFTLFLGVIHMFVAMGIKAANLIAKGHFWDAVCDVFFWYIFYVGEIFFLIKYIPYYCDQPWADVVAPYGKWLLLVGFVLILFTKGRKSKNLFVKMFGGITCVYSLVNMLSDALSYTRLMAMGLATGVIINVFNQIGAVAGGLAGGYSFRFIFFIIIFIVANLFNFAINALSAYVNSCRLTYIEFFGKFYEGEGREYLPLTRNTEYIYIED